MISLGPNLNLQVNAIGHLRRRKRVTKEDNASAIVTAAMMMKGHADHQEDNEEEESVQFKMLNGSSVMPLKHARYTEDN